jgi:hypothetical protein
VPAIGKQNPAIIAALKQTCEKNKELLVHHFFTTHAIRENGISFY